MNVNIINKLLICSLAIILSKPIFAATAIDLRHQSEAFLNKSVSFLSLRAQAKLEKNHSQMTHARIQQTYAGYSVWGATGVIHKSSNKNSMNGIIYEGLEKDLANTPEYIFGAEQKVKAMQKIKSDFAKKNNLKDTNFTEDTAEITIFLDEKNKAHYAYVISFYFADSKPQRPKFIVDAENFTVYREWDDIMRAPDMISAGGIGGNEKIGRKIYDASPGQPKLMMQSAPSDFEIFPGQKALTCILQNDDISVIHGMRDNKVISTNCFVFKQKHNDVAWLSLNDNQTRWKDDEINGGFAPSLDAFYGATVVTNLFREWYGIFPFVEKDGKTPIKIILRMHQQFVPGVQIPDAFWDPKKQIITLGEGGEVFYPLSDIHSVAHEIGHGFTQFHANFDRSNMVMSALHESFSDMTSAATEFYITGKNSWEQSTDVVKDGFLQFNRYMNDPPKDGHSIDHMRDLAKISPYDFYGISGIFSKAFYLLATTKGWDTRKAYDVMVYANMNYWTSSMSYVDVGCGMISAAQELEYNVGDVRAALEQVGIVGDC